MKKHFRHHTIILAIITCAFLILAGFLRFYNLSEAGFKFCDEGYHLYYPQKMFYSESPYPLLYFKHGLMLWIYLGIHLLSPTITGTLYWSASCGLFTCILTLAFFRYFTNIYLALASFCLMCVNYYILFYHRCHMSDGYALMFYVLTILLLLLCLEIIEIIPYRLLSFIKNKKHYGIMLLILPGLLLGFAFTVRIQTCLTLIGNLCALGLALIIKEYPKFKFNKIFRYTIFFTITIVLAICSYTLFMYFLNDWTVWPSTIEWYKKNLFIASGKRSYPLIHVLKIFYHLCTPPFLTTALIGILNDIINIKKISILRLWLLISTLGLCCMYIIIKMPWPRAYLYLILYFIIYWSIGLYCIYSLINHLSLNRTFKYSILGLFVFITFFSELLLDRKHIKARSNFNEAISFIEKNGKAAIGTSHAWPILQSALRVRTLLMYAGKSTPKSYKEACGTIGYAYTEKKIRYIIFEHYFTRFADDDSKKYFSEFIVTNPPTAIFKNDFGEDFHTCMDAFGDTLEKDIFSANVIVYDIQQLIRKKVSKKPVSYTTPEHLVDKFYKKYSRRGK